MKWEILFSGSALYCYYCNDFKTGLLNCSDPFSYDKTGVKISFLSCRTAIKLSHLYLDMEPPVLPVNTWSHRASVR